MNLTSDGLHTQNGYTYIKCLNHPRTNKDGCVKRAVLVLEQTLGRHLTQMEDTHHINKIRDDDRPENLIALTRSEHRKLHYKAGDFYPPPHRGGQKGRPFYGNQNNNKTHCKRGHKFTPENTYSLIRKDGHTLRNCKQCRKLYYELLKKKTPQPE